MLLEGIIEQMKQLAGNLESRTQRYVKNMLLETY